MEPHENENVNEASGTSIFWALIALALNAMTEPSRIGILLGAGTVTNSNPGFDPLRSSPVLCAAETVLDIFFFIRGPKIQRTPPSTAAASNTTNTTEHRPDATEQDADVLPRPVVTTTHCLEPKTDNAISSRATLKVLAFFLGVLPQAIKLFSMKGIVGTQICAAMFLAASVARPISCKSPSDLAASIDVLKNIDTDTAPRLLWLLGFAMIAHPVVYVWLYFNITTANDSNSSFNILFYITLVCIKACYLLFTLLTVLFNLVWRRSLPLTKWLPLFVCVKIQTLATPIEKTTAQLFPSLTMAYSLITLGLITSLLVSGLCIASGRLLTRVAARRVAWSGGHSDSSLYTMSTNADESGSMGLSQVIDGLKQTMFWLKGIFVDLCQALDNHGKWLTRTWYKAFGASTEQVVLACGIFNLLTAVLYYLVVFDATGTSSPSWNSVLG